MKLSPLGTNYQTPIKQSSQTTVASPQDTVDFLLNSYELKHTPRRGWLHRGNKNPESVGAHSWGVSLLILKLLPKHLNLAKALAYASIHDLPEALTGDIIPSDKISPQEKSKQENTAMKALCSKFPQLAKLWQDYEAKGDQEARFVKELDGLDVAIQCLSYKKQRNLDYTELLEKYDSKISTPVLRDLYEEIKRRFKQIN